MRRGDRLNSLFQKKSIVAPHEIQFLIEASQNKHAKKERMKKQKREIIFERVYKPKSRTHNDGTQLLFHE